MYFTIDIEYVLETLQPIERRIQLKNGMYYEARIRPYRTEYNFAEGILITFVDITGLIHQQNEVLSANQRLDRAMELGRMAWWEYDINKKTFKFSARKAVMLGYDKDSFAFDINTLSKLIHKEDRSFSVKSFEDLFYGKSDTIDVIYRIIKADNTYAWHHNRGDIIERDADGNPSLAIGTVIDITDYKVMEKQLINQTKLT